MKNPGENDVSAIVGMSHVYEKQVVNKHCFYIFQMQENGVIISLIGDFFENGNNLQQGKIIFNYSQHQLSPVCAIYCQ